MNDKHLHAKVTVVSRQCSSAARVGPQHVYKYVLLVRTCLLLPFGAPVSETGASTPPHRSRPAQINRTPNDPQEATDHRDNHEAAPRTSDGTPSDRHQQQVIRDCIPHPTDLWRPESPQSPSSRAATHQSVSRQLVNSSKESEPI